MAAELELMKAENQALRTAEQSIRAEGESLKPGIEALRIENETLRPIAQRHADSNAALGTELHSLWNSRSWRLLRPLRNLVRKARGFDKETLPTVQSEFEALRTILAIRQSMSWELTAPLRIFRRTIPLTSKRTEVAVQYIRQDTEETAIPESHSVPRSNWDELISRGAVLPWRNNAIADSSPIGASARPKILFASHEATRTGAPLILLSLVRHFAESGRYELFVFCDRPGPLLEAFAEYAHVLDRSRHDLFVSSPTIDDLIGAFGNDRPLLAICNTSIVNHYAVAFQQSGIPVITLVHELADQFTPSHFRAIYAASDRVVFPAEFVRDAADAKASLPDGKAVVIPQGLLDPDFGAGDPEAAYRAVRRELGVPENSFIVLGCGSIDLRKGIDLFVSLAAAVLRKTNDPIHFVWVGPDVFGLAHWVRKDLPALGIAGRLHMVGEQDAPARFFQAADVFGLTSREDPFPCVVHEAMVAGTPVVAFEGAGGAPEALADGSGMTVGYRDIDAMAETILKLYRDPEELARIAESALTRVLTKYRFEDYYDALVRLAQDELGVGLGTHKGAKLNGKLRVAMPGSLCNQDQQKRDFLAIKETDDFELDFFLSPFAPRLSRDEAIQLFMREWATLTGRKPCTGFNPQIYAQRALDPNESDIRDPFASFIEKGKPSGPWLTPLIREFAGRARPTSLRTALHVHAHYPDLIPELLGCLANNISECDLFISTSRNEDLGLLQGLLAPYDKGEVQMSVVPNRGRDIGPFLTEYKWLNENYDLIGHIHTKKTPHHPPAVGQIWRKFLWHNLIGEGYAMMDWIAKHFEDDPNLGLVFPDDPHLVGWWRNNKGTAKRLGLKMGSTLNLPDAFDFPIGTMFWCRPKALRPLFELGLTWDDYPLEPVPIDGTLLHALERLLPLVTQHEGYRIAATHIAGMTR